MLQAKAIEEKSSYLNMTTYKLNKYQKKIIFNYKNVLTKWLFVGAIQYWVCAI